MKIIHYSLGFPPYRSGGMTTYCMDLMSEQSRMNNDVGLLWPGAYSLINHTTKIKQRKNYVYNDDIVCMNFELINSLPVPLLNGIIETDAFKKKVDEKVFYNFFVEQKIDVFHVHTLMGLPIECITGAKKARVKTIFTTHDYFGICFKWGLFWENKICSNNENCEKCINCNQTALSLEKISFLQSSVYRGIKNSVAVKLLRKKHNEKLYISNQASDVKNVGQNNSVEAGEKYISLRNYYISILESFDVICFNSKLTRKVYEKYAPKISSGRVLNVTHANIDNRIKARNYGTVLNIGYLGPITIHKGFFFAVDVLDKIYDAGKRNFKLHIFAQTADSAPYMEIHKPYSYEQLSEVMEEIDVLIMPSQWYETFGFTVLEAISYGVPVIVSENVGAKDIVLHGKNGFVLNNDAKQWVECITELIDHPEVLSDMNDYMVRCQHIQNFSQHTKQILKLYSEETVRNLKSDLFTDVGKVGKPVF